MDGVSTKCHLPDHHMITGGGYTGICGSQGKLLGGSGEVLVAAEWLGHCTLGRCLFEHGCDCTDIAIVGDIKALPGGEVDHPFTI